MPNLLVEIGTEELPAGVQDIVYQEFRAKAESVFQKARLPFTSAKVEATPRRIALYMEGLPAKQSDETLEISGPSYEKAYGPDGKPTPALEGFLKSKGAAAAQLLVKEMPKGKFVFIEQKNTGKAAATVLPQLLQELFSSVTFPKNMRWEKTGFRFPRPVRWVVALLDKKVLNFSFASLKAGNKSYGHRFLAPKAFAVTSADWNLYTKALRKAHVILPLEERKKAIAKALSSQFNQSSYDEELVHLTAQLVEEPFLLQGSFSKEYLELPKEVLASCMKKNQKIFACYDNKGYLTGKFVAVLNGKRNNPGGIRAGYENVLYSRLKDARYFYKADTKEPLEKKAHLLEQVTYLGKLGNMLQKTHRMEKLAGEFAKLCGKDNLSGDLKRAAHLSKIDLMTHLVYEFPDLQGIVGREYASAAGESENVAKAIGAQYLPQSLTVDYRDVKKQMNELGAMLGILDRLDLLAGAFGTGIEPTGSQDPYALRRAGGIIVKLIRTFNLSFSLDKAIQACSNLYGSELSAPVEWKNKIKKFFEDRLVFELQVKPGTREHEILQAVIRSGADNLADVFERYARLQALFEREQGAFIKTAKVIERTANITKGVKDVPSVKPDLLKESTEKHLFQVLESTSAELKKLAEGREFEKATRQFGEAFYKPLNDFFEQVMVNVEDTSIRANRQALMRQINRLYTDKVADLSVLSRLDQG